MTPATIIVNVKVVTMIRIMIIRKKEADESSSILFIDSSHEFQGNKRLNILTDTHIKQITNTYK